MSVNLVKGTSVNLKKEAPNLKRVLIGLGWDPEKSLFGNKMDIDASVICIDKNGESKNVVCYNNLRYLSGVIRHYGDNLTGDGDGDDEQIEINLDKLPDKITRLSIIINIFSAYTRNQHFGKVKNCFVHAMDMDTKQDLVRYNVDGNYDGKTGIFVADIYRNDKDEWEFEAIGEGVRVARISDMVKMKCN